MVSKLAVFFIFTKYIHIYNIFHLFWNTQKSLNKTKLQFSFCGNAVCRLHHHVSYVYKKTTGLPFRQNNWIKLVKRQQTFRSGTIWKVQPLSYKRQVINTLSHLTAVFSSDTVDLEELSYILCHSYFHRNNQIIRKKGENSLIRRRRI